MFDYFKILRFTFLICFLFLGVVVNGQTIKWLSGYDYRKPITLDKTKVEGDPSYKIDPLNVIVLVEMEDPDFKYQAEAFSNKLKNPSGLDISFASAAAGDIPLKFQLDSYNPVTGKISCWVLIPVLSCKRSTSPATVIYFYYGSAILHQPDDPAVVSMWNTDYSYAQHFNKGAEGKIGSGKAFNGFSDRQLGPTDRNVEITITAWIKLNQIGSEQMIVSNDSLLNGGYQLKVNAAGNLVFGGFKLQGAPWTLTCPSTLSVNRWYHVCVIGFYDKFIHILIDNIGQVSAPQYTISPGGQVIIGASKQGNSYFNGMIDELKIGKISKPVWWANTEYINQQNAAAFIVVGLEEINPLILANTYTFTGAATTVWERTNNWSVKGVAPNYSNVIIKANKTTELSSNVILNKLTMETGSKLILHANLRVLNGCELSIGSLITSNEEVSLKLEGNVLNNGSIDLSGNKTKLIFSGSNTSLSLLGAGTTTASSIEMDRPGLNLRVNLNAPLQVKTSLNLINGTLNANGKLLLLSTNGKTATLLPVLNAATIIGNVEVQTFIDGSFPSPSTGRGWRLLSSPVRNSGNAGDLKYQLQAIKSSMFVTGKAGIANGFDASPSNGNTVYTHDQSLPGTLAQKYLAIPNMQIQLPLGKGFFVFSRGSRLLPNAYQNQIQTVPFSNAAPYLITYSGTLFTGELLVEVFNKDKGEEGDGYNLLGNPYASAIRWGSLVKVNVGPFIWLFDPLNNTYRVSEDPNEIIPVGAGFFIRVKQGYQTGSVSFKESSKLL